MANNDDNNRHEKKEFPGYPHYPAKEDILNQKDAERVDVDVENLSRSHRQAGSPLPADATKPPAASPVTDEADEDESAGKSESDLTRDDLIALGEQDADFGRSKPLNDNGAELDIPGAEEDDSNEEIGEEDEENNYYSLGGDAHENLEEDNG